MRSHSGSGVRRQDQMRMPLVTSCSVLMRRVLWRLVFVARLPPAGKTAK